MFVLIGSFNRESSPSPICRTVTKCNLKYLLSHLIANVHSLSLIRGTVKKVQPKDVNDEWFSIPLYLPLESSLFEYFTITISANNEQAKIPAIVAAYRDCLLVQFHFFSNSLCLPLKQRTKELHLHTKMIGRKQNGSCRHKDCDDTLIASENSL